MLYHPVSLLTIIGFVLHVRSFRFSEALKRDACVKRVTDASQSQNLWRTVRNLAKQSARSRGHVTTKPLIWSIEWLAGAKAPTMQAQKPMHFALNTVAK